jgi:hypothetical protein
MDTMRQVGSDGVTNYHRLGLIPAHPHLQPIGLQLESKRWLRRATALRTWAFSTPQHRLSPRWYASRPHPCRANLARSSALIPRPSVPPPR